MALVDQNPVQSLDEAIGQARELAQQGRFLDAIDLGQNLVSRVDDFSLERDLRDWRHQAYYRCALTASTAPWPPRLPDPFPHLVDELPEISAAELSYEVLGGAILHHGSLLVRELIPPARMTRHVSAIQEAFRQRKVRDKDQAHYAELRPINDADLNGDRIFPGFTVLTVDAPHFLANWMDELQLNGVLGAVSSYLGERPAISAYKAALYHVPAQPGTLWHQDGAFFDKDIRTVNLWVAGDECGVDAPGLDVVPWRFNEIVETGTTPDLFVDGHQYDWAVGKPVVERITRDRRIISPVFKPGDAMLFDHLCLHRTGARPEMTKRRYSIETWMFAPSHYRDPMRSGDGVMIMT